MNLYAEMTDEELDRVDLVAFTKLNVGDRVSHKNAGKWGGDGIISSQPGTVVGHQNHGVNHWGGLCVNVIVKWEDGSEYEMDYSFAIKL